MQEVFVSVWHHAGSYCAAKSQPQTWLASIVRNRCLDRLRRREPDTVTLTRDDDEVPRSTFPPTAERPSRCCSRLRRRNRCANASTRSKAAQKQAIALAFYQGLSHGELALHLRQPLGTVKSWVRRGLERLKDCLDRAGFVP